MEHLVTLLLPGLPLPKHLSPRGYTNPVEVEVVDLFFESCVFLFFVCFWFGFGLALVFILEINIYIYK